MKKKETPENNNHNLSEPIIDYDAQASTIQHIPEIIREDLQISLDQIENGKYKPFKEVLSRLK